MSEIETKRDPHATLRAMLAVHAGCGENRCAVECEFFARQDVRGARLAFYACGFVQDAAKHGIDLHALLADSDALAELRPASDCCCGKGKRDVPGEYLICAYHHEKYEDWILEQRHKGGAA